MRNLPVKLMLATMMAAVLAGGVVSITATTTDSLRKQTDALCEIYNPDNWAEFHNSGDMGGFSREMARRIRDTIESEKLLEIYRQLADRYHDNPQAFIRDEIRKLTGDSWDCQYLEVSTQHEG